MPKHNDDHTKTAGFGGGVSKSASCSKVVSFALTGEKMAEEQNGSGKSSCASSSSSQSMSPTQRKTPMQTIREEQPSHRTAERDVSAERKAGRGGQRNKST